MNPKHKTPLLLAVLPVMMLGGAFSSKIFYNTFCRVTGYGGTIQRATDGAREVLDRTVTVQFDTNEGMDAPIDFKPAQHELNVRLGENTLAYFEASNPTSEPITVTATFNVTPFKVGPYFKKIQCFCFTEQHLDPGEHVEMPVLFFVDPAMDDERQLDDVQTITLSYTFFRSTDGVPDAAPVGQSAAKSPASGGGGQG
jgi:cytochrome c oxidase assembly protein subunit 11